MVHDQHRCMNVEEPVLTEKHPVQNSVCQLKKCINRLDFMCHWRSQPDAGQGAAAAIDVVLLQLPVASSSSSTQDFDCWSHL